MPSSNIAVNKVQPSLAFHPTIKDTGARGFLLWMKTDPVLSKVYAAAFPHIQTAAGLYARNPTADASALSGLSAYLPGSGGTLLPAPIGRNQHFSFGALGQDNSDSLSVVSVPDLSVTTDPSVDAAIASAPTDASTSNSFLSNISSFITAAGQAALTADQISTANKVTNLQLQQAAAGKPPLNLSSYGLSTTPGFNLGLSSSTETTMLIAVGILAAVFLLPKMMKR